MTKFEDRYGRPIKVGDRVQTYTDMYGHDKIEGRVIKIERRGEEEGDPFVDVHVLIGKVYRTEHNSYKREKFPNHNTIGQIWISGDCSEWYLRLDND